MYFETEERTHIWLNEGPFATDYIVHGMTRNIEEDEDDPSVVPYTNPCHSDWFYMDNYDVGTNRFTMKIDAVIYPKTPRT